MTGVGIELSQTLSGQLKTDNCPFFTSFDPQTFTGFSGDDDNSSDAGLTKEERKEKYRCQARYKFVN